MRGARIFGSEMAKCIGLGCERRASCYRFRLLPKGRDVLSPAPVKPVSQACAYFHPVNNTPNALMQTAEEAEAWAQAQPQAKGKAK